MILDKCKNCKWYIPYQKDVKAILSKETKTKYLDKGHCLYFYKTVKSDAWWTINLYRKETKSNGWCERYDRKNKEKNNKHCVYNYTCPNCHTILSEVEDCNYCPECGAKLDWSENEGGE